MPNIWYKNKETDTIWWKDDPTVIGVWIFSFDKTTEFNMFHDYPYKLTKEQKQIFDRNLEEFIDKWKNRENKYEWALKFYLMLCCETYEVYKEKGIAGEIFDSGS